MIDHSETEHAPTCIRDLKLHRLSPTTQPHYVVLLTKVLLPSFRRHTSSLISMRSLISLPYSINMFLCYKHMSRGTVHKSVFFFVHLFKREPRFVFHTSSSLQNLYSLSCACSLFSKIQPCQLPMLSARPYYPIQRDCSLPRWQSGVI
jgi:hypothetical protein